MGKQLRVRRKQKGNVLDWVLFRLKSKKTPSRMRQKLIRLVQTRKNMRSVFLLDAILLNSKENTVKRGLAANALFEIAKHKGGESIAKLLQNARVVAEQEENIKLADHIAGLIRKLIQEKKLGLPKKHISEADVDAFLTPINLMGNE